MHHDSIFLADLLNSRLAVRGGRAEIEMSRLGGIVALECDMAVAAAYIQSLLIFEMILFFAHDHSTRTSDIDNAEFTALGEVIGAKDFRSAQKKIFLHRNGTSGDDAVEHGVDHVDLIGHHYILHEIFLADALSVIVFRIDVARCLSYLAIKFHILFRLFSNICENTAIDIKNMSVDGV